MGSAVTESCLEALLARQGQCALMANILTRTSRMLEAARSSEWPLVVAMENKRSQLLKECFAEPVMPENSEIFSEALAIMLHMNEELVALLERAKAEVAAATKGQTKTVKNLQHYLAVESSDF